LRLFAVVEAEPGGPFGRSAELRTRLFQDQRRVADEYLGTIAARSQQRGLVVETATAAGDASEQILAAAMGPDVSFLVLSTHGRGGLQRLFLGSVADKVMRLATCDTLVISPAEDHPSVQSIYLRRIAVPLDGSALAETALGPASTLAAAARARLLLVRVESAHLTATATTTMAYPYVPAHGELRAELERDAARYLEQIQDRIGGAVPTEGIVLSGAPALTLAAYLQEQAIDLVIMTTQGHGGLRRLVLGSTADRLIRLGLDPMRRVSTAAGVRSSLGRRASTGTMRRPPQLLSVA
jgi:nucleotide-binding universal stress UspA family protein